jgi:hypothetical protein
MTTKHCPASCARLLIELSRAAFSGRASAGLSPLGRGCWVIAGGRRRPGRARDAGRPGSRGRALRAGGPGRGCLPPDSPAADTAASSALRSAPCTTCRRTTTLGCAASAVASARSKPASTWRQPPTMAAVPVRAQTASSGASRSAASVNANVTAGCTSGDPSAPTAIGRGGLPTIRTTAWTHPVNPLRGKTPCPQRTVGPLGRRSPGCRGRLRRC